MVLSYFSDNVCTLHSATVIFVYYHQIYLPSLPQYTVERGTMSQGVKGIQSGSHPPFSQWLNGVRSATVSGLFPAA